VPWHHRSTNQARASRATDLLGLTARRPLAHRLTTARGAEEPPWQSWVLSPVGQSRGLGSRTRITRTLGLLALGVCSAPVEGCASPSAVHGVCVVLCASALFVFTTLVLLTSALLQGLCNLAGRCSAVLFNLAVVTAYCLDRNECGGRSCLWCWPLCQHSSTRWQIRMRFRMRYVMSPVQSERRRLID
jgi:hypothetical protein